MKVISLGWGVQSFTLAAMSALGEIERVDYAIHADTTHESSLTYDFARRWTGWLEEHGIPVVVVATHEKHNIVDKWGGMQLPAYTASRTGEGRIRRQCTYEWKIRPMRQWLQEHRHGEQVEQWIGISWDEVQRMKDADVKYITNRWPLIEKRMTRQDCKKWLEEHGLEVPPRSACTFCPFKTTQEWRLTKSVPADWREAVSVDDLIRDTRPPEQLFVHPSRKPLADVDFRTEEEKGQLSLWDAECFGVCGI